MQTDHSPPLSVKIWGDFACFTRPEMKVERVSYPMITPSAARGVLEAIFWKPEFTWQVEEIWVLHPIRYFSILRNEVNSRASERTVTDWQQRGGGFYATADRAQRHTLGLREVSYIIKAQPRLRQGVQEDRAKYRDQFRRRVRDGRCFATPYLGCREFSAAFAEAGGDERPIALTEDLGPMLLDVTYSNQSPGRGTPHFFNAHLENGVLSVPSIPRGEE